LRIWKDNLYPKYEKTLHFIFLILLNSCKKESIYIDGVKNQDEREVDCGGICSPCSIEYAETGFFGPNALFGDDTLRLLETAYSLQAKVPEGSSLKIVMTRLYGDTWFIGDENNWATSDFTGRKQTFTVVNPGTADVEMIDGNAANIDTFLIQYYENGTAETKRKIIIRQ
jgi:hypothetical protein